MTPADDLKHGMYVAVSAFRVPEILTPFGYTAQPSRTCSDGTPLEVLAVSLPFICVTDGNDTYSIDIREVELQRLDKRYVREMRKGRCRVSREAKSVHDSRECTRCGARLSEKRCVVAGETQWHLACRECGFDYGVMASS